ncbi:hypothetical protein ACHAXR_011256 [Thalassiosira sp. AJA248-18]
MKVIASLIILASTCTAFNAKFNANKKVVSKVNTPTKKVANKKTLSRRDVFIGAGAATIASTFWDVEFVGVVRDRTPLPPINGVYSDPNHKKGYRVVRAVDKSNAVVTLQDEPNGAIITVDGKIKSKSSGTTITLDFSSKGGPKDIVATFSNGSGGEQLFFSDGNAWTKSVGVDGIYSDPNHPAGYRVVRVSKGKMYITLQDDPKGEIIEVVGKKGKDGYLIDFSPKGGPQKLAVTFEDGKLVFPDGNAWTKV